jgi:hypothetical protein
MNTDNQIPILVCHVLEADIAKDTSVIEEDIDPAVVLDGGFYDLFTIFDAVVVGDCFAACGFDFVDDYICGLELLGTSHPGSKEVFTLVELPSPLNDPPRSLTTTLAPLDPKNRA